MNLRPSMIFLIIVVLIFAHHYAIHGYLYDVHNLGSHEALAMLFAGAALVTWVLRK